MSIGRVPGVTGIQPSIVDAKGDLIVATAADSVSRLAVGSNGTVLTADSAEATGVKWAAVSSGLVKITSNTFSAVSSVSLPNSTFSSTYRNYKVVINIDTNASSPSGIFLRMRNAGSDKTGGSYFSGLWKIPYTGSAAMTWQTTGGTSSQIFDSFKDGYISLDVANPFSSTERTSIQVDTVEGELVYRAAGIVTFLADDSCDSLTFYMTSGNMTGRYDVYGYAN